MLRKPKVDARVEVVDGSLVGLRGTVVVASSARRGKISIRLDPPKTWSGHSVVRISARKVRPLAVRDHELGDAPS